MARPVVPVLALALLAVGCSGSVGSSGTQTERELGAVSHVGDATAQSYAEFDEAGKPLAIGLKFSSNFFDELPEEHSDLHNCFDKDEDGVVDPMTECLPEHGWVIPLPSGVASRSDIPFQWAGLNWNPMGHIPPGVYDVPHFDIHFYMEPIESVFALHPGPCGELIRCDQFEIGRKPVPPNYVAQDYISVDAVAPAMGNHLIDPTGPEFNGEPFTRTWIYGTYDGRITFYEEMVTLAFLREGHTECFEIKSPPAVAVGGYYPTATCYGSDPDTGDTTVSLEQFRLREASSPEAVPEQLTDAG